MADPALACSPPPTPTRIRLPKADEVFPASPPSCTHGLPVHVCPLLSIPLPRAWFRPPCPLLGHQHQLYQLLNWSPSTQLAPALFCPCQGTLSEMQVSSRDCLAACFPVVLITLGHESNFWGLAAHELTPTYLYTSHPSILKPASVGPKVETDYLLRIPLPNYFHLKKKKQN